MDNVNKIRGLPSQYVYEGKNQVNDPKADPVSKEGAKRPNAEAVYGDLLDEASADERAKRVQEIKSAVQQGTYKVDSIKVAQKLSEELFF